MITTFLYAKAIIPHIIDKN